MAYDVTKITDGLGFGVGTISHAGTADDVLQAAEAVIQSPRILTAIDNKDGVPLTDDGCGDGRAVGKIIAGNDKNSSSKNRAKVFGGGATMAVAIAIGSGQAGQQALDDLFATSVQMLQQKGIDFGAHTDDHAAAPNCGCGAIDKAPAIIAAAVQYRPQIKDAMAALNMPIDKADAVLDAFAAYNATLHNATYAGQQVMAVIIDCQKVVKQLVGEHREKYIVLNAQKGMTVDQAAVRSATNDQVQVFGVDLWRLQELARMVIPDAPETALLSEVVYTLATAAVLTAGDLPVYLVR